MLEPEQKSQVIELLKECRAVLPDSDGHRIVKMHVRINDERKREIHDQLGKIEKIS